MTFQAAAALHLSAAIERRSEINANAVGDFMKSAGAV